MSSKITKLSPMARELDHPCPSIRPPLPLQRRGMNALLIPLPWRGGRRSLTGW